MDIVALIKKINCLNDYVATTQEASEKCRTSRIPLNMSTVLALKKIRSFEIEYVNKCEENGIACVIFERMLVLPPSKTWGVLCKEMVNLLQYWLDAVRKHLVKHSGHWWIFLKLLLRFVKEIRLKDSSVPNILVEHISECLLDLATADRPNAMQRYEILHCFNMYCSESSREIRFVMRNQFGQYFTKLANYMSGCGNLATQYSIMETLLRWLLPRQDRTLRITSATKWFPARLYADHTVDIFLERSWMNFFQDARDFLNSHNNRGDLITSVVCRRVTVGDIVIIADNDKMDSWLDINSCSKCISVLLDPRVLEVFGCSNHKSFETFVVSADNTDIAKLYRESNQTIVSVQTVTPPSVLPSCIKLGDDVSCHVTVVVSSRCDVKKLDDALRNIFEEKYQLLLNLEQEIPLSPPKIVEQTNKNKKSETDSRFSHPVEVKRRTCHAGYMVKSRTHLSCMSPSTASTSSLAQLHDKLAAIPKYTFDKEAQSVCALPDLSVVSEASELDERSTKTLHIESYNNCNKNQKTLDGNRKSQSDNESSRRHPETSRRKYRQLSPVVNDNEPSCLLVATIGSANDSVINDTVEKISNNKDFNPDNIIDLLVQEALQANLERDKDKYDSENITKEKEPQYISDNCDAIENTPNADIKINKPQYVSGNCDAIENTPNADIKIHKQRGSKRVSSAPDIPIVEDTTDNETSYVNTSCRSKRDQSKFDAIDRQCFDVQAVEEFFSQHFTENREGQLVISPTLAKKINETSSETSEHNIEDHFNLICGDLQDEEPCDLNEIEVLQCLNSIVDKVCDDFDKCTKYLTDNTADVDNTSDLEDNLPLKDILNTIQNINPKSKTTVEKSSCNKIKLKYKVATKKEKSKSRLVKRKNKLEIESVPKMSTIIEDNAETAIKSVVESNELNEPEENMEKQLEPVSDTRNDCTTPMLRRKRKLFSPKDEQLNEGIREEVCVEVHAENIVDEDFKIKKTPKSTATYKPYKEIEKERERYIRMPRNKKGRKAEETSPRSKKMNDLFDRVKDSANGEEVKLAKKPDLEVYNFSSDSDDDFKAKKIDVSKKSSVSSHENVETTVLRRGRVIKKNYTKKTEEKSTKRKVNRRQKAKKDVEIERVDDLIDERMRENKEVLDTSIVLEKPNVIVPELELVLEKPPEMEAIDVSEEKSSEIQRKTKRSKKTKAKAPIHKVVKKTASVKSKLGDDRTESPLPGLVVEKAPTAVKEEPLSANMVNKFKKICQNPEKYINESNTTQNLLSDTERIIYSPQNIDITDEILEVQLQFNSESKPRGKSTNKKPSSVKGKNLKRNNAKLANVPISETKSIASDDITGHGDSGEAPPSPKLIVESLQHRNLHTEYLDDSTKDYFNKLTEEINDVTETCRKDSTQNDIRRSVDNKKPNLDKKSCDSSPKSVRSAVVSIERMSLEDISRWLPSRRNSDTDEYSISSKKSKKSNEATKIVDRPKTLRKHSNSKDELQEPISSSLKNDLSPILKLNSSSRKSQNKSNYSVCSRKSPKISVKQENIMKTRKQPVRQAKCTPKSIISPIKLFEDIDSDDDKMSQISLSDEEEASNTIKIHNISRRRKSRTQSQCSIEEESVKETRSNKKKKETRSKTYASRSSASSTRVEESVTLKRSSEDGADGRKKRKLESNNNIGDFITASGGTDSSVYDWLKRTDVGSSRAVDISMSLRDSMQNVIEKLDTTLIEIHQNTSNKFVHLFVSAKQQLHDLKQTRHKMHKQIAEELLRDVIKLLDDKFASLDERSSEQDEGFMKQLIEQASAIIREDCKQKRVMVQLLKEDVQAVVQHQARQTH